MGHSSMDPDFHELRPWNEDRLIGAKQALKQQQVRFWLDHHRRLRDRALFDFAIDRKLYEVLTGRTDREPLHQPSHLALASGGLKLRDESNEEKHAMRMVSVITACGVFVLSGCQKPADQTAPAADSPLSAAVTPGLPSSSPAAAPPAADTSLGQAMDSKGELRLEVTEAVRTGGVLTVKTRVTMTGGKAGSRPLPGASTGEVYLTAADKKYLLLKDDHDKELMSSNSYPNFDQVGATQRWWGKFPAPAPEVKAVNFYFYGFDPVENVAITDR